MVDIKKSGISETYARVCVTVLNGIKDYFSEKMKKDVSNEEVIDILRDIYCENTTDTTRKRPKNDGSLYIN